MDSTRVVHISQRHLSRRLVRYVSKGAGAEVARRCGLDPAKVASAYNNKIVECMRAFDLGPDFGEGSVKYESYMNAALGVAAYELLREAGFAEEEAFRAYDYMSAPLRRLSKAFYRVLDFLPGGFYVIRRSIISDLTGARRLCWSTKLLRNDERVLEYEISRCLYHEVCCEHGCPEFTRAFCKNDSHAYSSLRRRIRFSRMSSFGEGGPCCHDKFELK